MIFHFQVLTFVSTIFPSCIFRSNLDVNNTYKPHILEYNHVRDTTYKRTRQLVCKIFAAHKIEIMKADPNARARLWRAKLRSYAREFCSFRPVN